MDDRVAGRTDCDQPFLDVNARPPVVDGPLVPCPAALASIAVAQEHLVADAGEVAGGMSALPVTGGEDTKRNLKHAKRLLRLCLP